MENTSYYYNLKMLLLIMAAGFFSIGAAFAGELDNNIVSNAEAVDFMSGAYVGGASTLVRSKDGIRMTYHTQGLEPGATYTAWWIIFNRPDKCSGGMCGPDDMSMNAEATQASMMWASGVIVGQDGIGNFYASLGKEQSSGEIIKGPGLLSPRQAEVHIVLRSHGLPLPGFTAAQLGSLQGGCNMNTCRNDQMVMHLAH